MQYITTSICFRKRRIIEYKYSFIREDFERIFVLLLYLKNRIYSIRMHSTSLKRYVKLFVAEVRAVQQIYLIKSRGIYIRNCYEQEEIHKICFQDYPVAEQVNVEAADGRRKNYSLCTLHLILEHSDCGFEVN